MVLNYVSTGITLPLPLQANFPAVLSPMENWLPPLDQTLVTAMHLVLSYQRFS
jgi:hypothetical protein